LDLFNASTGLGLHKPIAQLDHEIAIAAHSPSRRPGQRDRLERRQRPRESHFTKHGLTGADCSIRTDQQGQGAEQLGKVDSLSDVTGRYRTRFTPEEPDLAAGLTKEMGGGKAAMTHLMGV